MHFRLAPRSMTLHDLELLLVCILGELLVILQIWETTTAKQMTIDPYCQLQNCSPLNVIVNNV